MAIAVFPNGIVPWTDRIDLVNIVYANDPNTLAAEIGAIETTLGTMPQVETAPPVGTQITYSTVGARIHDVLMGSQWPVCTVTNPSFNVTNEEHLDPHFNGYNSLYDPFGWYNGTDITVKADGWYTITANQTIGWWSSGYVYMTLAVGGVNVSDMHWDWDFPGNGHGGWWGGRSKIMSITWQGIVHSGTRIQVFTENATGKSPMNVTNAYLRVKYDRQVSHTQQG